MVTTEVWTFQSFPSGSCIVTADSPTKCMPWLYIYGPIGADDDSTDRNRYAVCMAIRDYLNGGARPAWLDDLRRTSETHACDLDGTSISAIGPMFDADPPNLNWVEDNSDTMNVARARLMDRLFLKK